MTTLTTNSLLRDHLDRLGRTDAGLADRIAAAEPADLTWDTARTGEPVASLNDAGRAVTLCSRYDPSAETERLLREVDLSHHACVIVLGLGVGHHVLELISRITSDTLVIVYEPDVALLRAVLERVDHRAWIGRPNVVLCDDQVDRAALLRRIEPFTSLLTQGTVLVAHPPTRQRYPKLVQQFSEAITDLLAYARTHVATQLVNATRTYSNLTNNLPAYAAGPTTNELHNLAVDIPAVCVSAGPSFARNVDLLRDPAVRSKVIVITAQTTLKPLLDRGIRPDIVTALDYHEVSRRFYEDLPPLDDVTLVAEPLANAAILDSFPGPIRVTQSEYLNKMLGSLARPIVHVPYGATVAHLSFYVAQHLGCDPIILVGQDLAFSDGLYYAPGMPIHNVWAPEVGRFNTIEMMQWKRIARLKGHLKADTDIHGRRVYTDEQMRTYLRQFEKDFAAAKQTVIDATEGGVPKAHAMPMPLAEALRLYANRPAPKLPLPPRELDRDRLAATLKTTRQRLAEIQEIRRLSQQTIPILRQIAEHQRDEQRVNRLFQKLEKNRKRVQTELAAAFDMVNHVNAIGAFRRARRDRMIHHTEGDEATRQTARIDRDIENLDWLIQACDEAITIVHAGITRLEAAVHAARSPQSPQTVAAI